jgi:hypothetical protein
VQLGQRSRVVPILDVALWGRDVWNGTFLPSVAVHRHGSIQG